MFWKVNYIVDDGYDWYKRICIINADTKERAIEILYTEIGSKLKGERCILSKYIEITECENDVVLYDGRK